VHIRHAFEFICARLGTLEFVFAFTRPRTEVTPASAKKQAVVIEQAFGLPVVFILPDLPAWARRRFIEQRTAFITPQRQMFLPDAGFDYRDRVRRLITPHGLQDDAQKLQPRAFTPSEQQALLFMLQQPGLEFHAEELASTLGVSQMTVSRAFRALQERGLVTRPTKGRERPAQLRQPKEEIWEAAQEFLQSPVRQELVLPAREAPFLDAGLTALARVTDLVPPPWQVVATSSKAWREWSTQGGVKPSQKAAPEAGELVVQLWAYAPEPLARSGAVDPLSLLLSFRDSKDERTEMALDELLEVAEWNESGASIASGRISGSRQTGTS
jgi:DNA-binding MarR family transcriptional regulator